MMNASELVAIRNAVTAKWAQEKEKKAKLLAGNSMEFCESVIAPLLEEKACDPKGGVISIELMLEIFTDDYDNVGVIYKDKRFSISGVEDYLKLFDYTVIVKFENRCYGPNYYKLIVKVA